MPIFKREEKTGMSNIKVSVLLTFYNQEKYVDKALESILDQKTNFDYEVLVGDDGSCDHTIEKVQSWIDRFPQKVHLYVMPREEKDFQPGFRASRNRLNLLNHVKGDYFIYLDGDDYFSNMNKLQNQVDILERGENLHCVACGHDITVLYPDGKEEIWNNKLKEVKKGYVAPKIYWNEGYYVHTDTLLVRSSVIQKIDTHILENAFNDILITYAIIQAGGIYYLPESMAVYFQTGDGIWTGREKILGLIRSIELYDICNIINPQFKRGTILRTLESWKELIENRHFIDSSDKQLQILLADAKAKKLCCTVNWIQYNDKTRFQKMLWLVYAYSKAYGFYFRFAVEHPERVLRKILKVMRVVK